MASIRYEGDIAPSQSHSYSKLFQVNEALKMSPHQETSLKAFLMGKSLSHICGCCHLIDRDQGMQLKILPRKSPLRNLFSLIEVF